jgi:hypothetical protein
MVTTQHVVALVILAAVGVAYVLIRLSAAEREAKLRLDENARLWSLITSMRAVTIDPPKAREVLTEFVREAPTEPLRERSNDQPGFNRYTEREVFTGEPSEEQ